MTRTSYWSFVAYALVSGLMFCASRASSGQTDSPPAVEFRRDILPILSENCYSCHGFDEQARQADLRLDVRDGAIAATDSGGFAIVPGQPEDSKLIERISSDDDDVRMPPPETEKAITPEQRELLYRWIAQGAEYQRHWSFVRPQATAPPRVDGAEHPIDRFIQARLATAGIRPSPKADDAKLLRRLSLDLIGLPPAVDEMDRFLVAAERDRRAAINNAVDRLLQSPHYGERWGRWWLDQARYADSNGYSIDAPRQIWKYRDWVIDAFNADMPFDQFTIEQLAGDMLPNASQSQKIATGFHRNTQINQEGGIDQEQFRVDSVFDRVATTGTVWLGLTIGCAQCHDHKFDPISQKEYYQLFAFFNNQDEPILKVSSEKAAAPALMAQFKAAERELDDFIAARAPALEAWESKLTDDEKAKMPKGIQAILKADKGKRTPKQQRVLFNIEVGKIDNAYQALKDKLEKLDGRVNGVATTLVMHERVESRKTTVFIKGDFTRPAEEVIPDTPSILPDLRSVHDVANRLDLAHWMIRADNPLTARVIVNRVWQVYFGRGLVATENDFGALGSSPTHPELLDWLAVEFQRRGWSLKELHRLIVTSHTYQQSSNHRSDLDRLDPSNELLARQTRLRLDAEIVRDVSLAVSGLLSSNMGGPPVYPPIPDGVMNRGQISRSWDVSHGQDRYRRGIYTFLFRATPPPSLNVFDAPDGFSACTRRMRSNTPLQALTLLNDMAFVEFARALETEIKREGLRNAFRTATARFPREDELQVLTKLSSFSAARVLLNMDETITRE